MLLPHSLGTFVYLFFYLFFFRLGLWDTPDAGCVSSLESVVSGRSACNSAWLCAECATKNYPDREGCWERNRAREKRQEEMIWKICLHTVSPFCPGANAITSTQSSWGYQFSIQTRIHQSTLLVWNRLKGHVLHAYKWFIGASGLQSPTVFLP